VILYELASGRLPFDADNFMGILTQHMYKAPVPIRALVPAPQEVPPGLEAIVLKCLSKRPEHRYQSMHEMIAEFDRLSSGGVPEAVPEMMSRSGGFNVPVDYFKKGQMPQPVPAMPSHAPGARRSWPLFAGLAGVLVAVGIVVAIFANSHTSEAVQTPASLAAEPPKATEAAAAAAAAVPAVTDAPAAAPATKQVVLAAEPIDSHVFQGETDLGASPLMITIEAGKPVELEIRRDGYKPEKITLDGAKTREIVKLDKIPRAGGAVYRPPPKKTEPAVTPPKKPKPAIGGSEIVNPWGN
jgi:eukaryotic-like serine/threonine-protein kinase